MPHIHIHLHTQDDWSPEAREAAAEARRKNSKSKSSKSNPETGKTSRQEEIHKNLTKHGFEHKAEWASGQEGGSAHHYVHSNKTVAATVHPSGKTVMKHYEHPPIMSFPNGSSGYTKPTSKAEYHKNPDEHYIKSHVSKGKARPSHIKP